MPNKSNHYKVGDKKIKSIYDYVLSLSDLYNILSNVGNQK